MTHIPIDVCMTNQYIIIYTHNHQLIICIRPRERRGSPCPRSTAAGAPNTLTHSDV